MTMKLAEVAKQIATHLNRLEYAQKDHGSALNLYWHSSAWAAGCKIRVRYVRYQGDGFTLTKADSLKYLQWLDAGNEGMHWTVIPQKWGRCMATSLEGR